MFTQQPIDKLLIMLRIPLRGNLKEILPPKLDYHAITRKHHINFTTLNFTKERVRAIRPFPHSVISGLQYTTKTQSFVEDRKSNPDLFQTAQSDIPPERKSQAGQKSKIFGSEPSSDTSSSLASQTRVANEDHKSEAVENNQLKDIKLELKSLKETFSLQQIPKDSLYLGLAGVLPYAATSISTVYLAWNINQPTVNGVLSVSPETAHQILELITPIQIGYGAVIISFLGAIHWGLEYAGYGGRHSYRRLIYGVITPIIAWPTLLMPVETALITQFLAFNFMYFVDARATVKGWFPPWYSIYRFILTFFVGASILLSLVGRGQITSSKEQKLWKENSLKTDRNTRLKMLENDKKGRNEIANAVKEIGDQD